MIEKRYEKRSRELEQRERNARQLDLIYAARREDLFQEMLERVGDDESFELVWNPDVLWARGPAIWPFAHVFDEIAGPDWKVTVQPDVHDGSPGWLFERVCQATQKAS